MTLQSRIDPVIGTFCRVWGGSLPPSESERLIGPVLALTLDTAIGVEASTRRCCMALDWFVRENTVAWLRLATLVEQAEVLAALPEIVDVPTATLAGAALVAATEAAAAECDATAEAVDGSVQEAAAGAEGWAMPAAAGLAASTAARGSHVTPAGRAVCAAARWWAAEAAARDACMAAAGDAAATASDPVAAARAAVEDVVVQLQRSAVELIGRMCLVSADPDQ